MKTILLSSIALLSLCAGSFAADLPAPRAPIAAPIFSAVPVFTWTGFYIGVQAGYTSGETSGTVVYNGITLLDDDFDLEGFVGGAHAGFNYQFGSFVAGIEGDIEATSFDGEVTRNNFVGAGDSLTADASLDFQGSVRARFGFAFDRALFYATGGLAWANFENNYTYFNGLTTTVTESFDSTEWGWTLGAGVEYAFTNNFTARLEYRYTQFESFNHTSVVLLPGAVADVEPKFHTVRVGLSYKF
jgi:outer membrane immunogenic protein